jgi:hypothetical protein
VYQNNYVYTFLYVKKHKVELENSLYEIEAPITKKIAEFEKQKRNHNTGG